jgi:hypothetical protein
MIRRGGARYLEKLNGALLAAGLSTILSACLISNGIRDFIFGSIFLTIVVARREGAPA